MKFDFETLRDHLDVEHRIAEYRARLAELDEEYRIDEYKNKVSALEWVRDQVDNSERNPSSAIKPRPKPRSVTARHDKPPPATLRQMIEEAIALLLPPFTRIDIEKKIIENYPSRANNMNVNTVRTTLKTLVDSKVLEVVRPAGGHETPTLYRLRKRGGRK